MSTQYLRVVAGIEVLNEALQELGELQGGLVREHGQLQDQAGPVVDVVGRFVCITHRFASRYRTPAARRTARLSGGAKTCR